MGGGSMNCICMPSSTRVISEEARAPRSVSDWAGDVARAKDMLTVHLAEMMQVRVMQAKDGWNKSS